MRYATAAVAVLGFMGGMIAPALANNSAVENALASQSNLSMFYQALLNTGVANELNENTEYTVFAPTNAAFMEIKPGVYPCFYSVQCRDGVAAILRNHIVPRNESIGEFANWGGDIPTLGNRKLYVEEAYKNQYTVEGHYVLTRREGDDVSLYAIDGVIADNRDLAQFQTQPNSNTVVYKTVTTHRTTVVTPPGSAVITPGRTTVVTSPASPSYSGGYLVPGGYNGSSYIYNEEPYGSTTVYHISPGE